MVDKELERLYMNKIITSDHGKYILKADLLEVSGWKEKTLWYWVKKSLNETNEKHYLKGKPDRAFPWAWVVAWRDGEIDGKAHPFSGSSEHVWDRHNDDQVEVRIDEDEPQVAPKSGGEEAASSTSPAVDNDALRKFNHLLENFKDFNSDEFKNELSVLIDQKLKDTLAQLPAPRALPVKKAPWWKNFGAGLLTGTLVLSIVGFLGVQHLTETHTITNTEHLDELKHQLADAVTQQKLLASVNKEQSEKYAELQGTIKLLGQKIDKQPAERPWFFWSALK
ncbi:MAG: hypothetical protein V3V74_07495 [Nitrosomonadaceae bacterium]